MRTYEALDMPLTRCVHFVLNREMEGARVVVDAAVTKGVRCVYWNYIERGRDSVTIADPLGTALELDHPPYGESWYRFMDDLITLAYRYPGLVIVVDRADVLLRERPDDMFNLIEAFLFQFHHWYDQKKPCHLCFQMEENDSVRGLFVREEGGV